MGSPSVSRSRSRQILGHLVGGGDVIVELNDSLLCVPENQRAAVGDAFRGGLAAQGLTVTERRFPSTSKPSFFARILGQAADREACELRAWIPAALWQSGVLDDSLPIHGLRYYVLPAGAAGAVLLEKLNFGTLPAQECIATMELIIFDVPAFGQMGLISSRLGLSQLQSRLGAI